MIGETRWGCEDDCCPSDDLVRGNARQHVEAGHTVVRMA
jgi:hypothetical protein